MLITNCEYLKSTITLLDTKEKDLPQFLLLGRSNVGKSSLLNKLLDEEKAIISEF